MSKLWNGNTSGQLGRGQPQPEVQSAQEQLRALQEKYDTLQRNHYELEADLAQALEKKEEWLEAYAQEDMVNQNLANQLDRISQEYNDATIRCRAAEAEVKILKQKQGIAQKTQEQMHELSKKCHESQKARQAAEAEAKKLQHQVLTFKKMASAAAKVADQISDEEVRQKFDKIYYALQDLAVGMLRISDISKFKANRSVSRLTSRPDTQKLSYDAKAWVDPYILNKNSLPASHTSLVLIAIMSRIVVELFEPEHYFGYSNNSCVRAARELASFLKGIRIRQTTVPRRETDQDFSDVDINGTKAWLERTRQLLFQLDAPTVHRADEELLNFATDDLPKMLRDAISLEWDNVKPAFRKILSSVLDLARALHRSKAVFEVQMIPAHLPDNDFSVFDSEVMMAASSGEEDVALIGRPIEVSVFPAVYKYGNEVGENVSVIRPRQAALITDTCRSAK